MLRQRDGSPKHGVQRKKQDSDKFELYDFTCAKWKTGTANPWRWKPGQRFSVSLEGAGVKGTPVVTRFYFLSWAEDKTVHPLWVNLLSCTIVRWIFSIWYYPSTKCLEMHVWLSHFMVPLPATVLPSNTCNSRLEFLEFKSKAVTLKSWLRGSWSPLERRLSITAQPSKLSLTNFHQALAQPLAPPEGLRQERRRGQGPSHVPLTPLSLAKLQFLIVFQLFKNDF